MHRPRPARKPWLDSLDPFTQERVYEVMRSIGSQGDAWHDRARALQAPLGRCAVGSQDFDHTLRAVACEGILRALRAGKAPDQARGCALLDMREAVRAHNRRIKDVWRERSECSQLPYLDALTGMVRAAVNSPRGPRL